MPAKSVAQRRFMGMVRATQKGEMKDPSPEVRDAAKDMSVKAVREFAKTKEKNLPDKKVDEATYPSDFKKGSGVAKKKTGGPNAQGPESGKKEINERRYVSKHRPPAGWKPYGGYEKEKPEVNATANRIDAIRKSIKTKKEEVEHLEEMPYQVYGSPDGKKEKKIGKPVKSKKYADARAAELADTHKATGGKYRSEYTEELEAIEEDSRRMSNKQHTQRVRQNIKSFGSNFTPPNNYDPDANRGKGEVLTRKQMEKKRRKALRQEETILERGDHWHPDPEQDRKLGGPGANQRAREDRAAASKPAAKKEDPKKLRKGESYMDYAKRQKGYTPPKKKEGLRDKLKRKLGLKEDAPTMSAGDGGFSGSADANGPTAGFDPPMTGLTTKKPRKFCNKKNKTKRC